MIEIKQAVNKGEYSIYRDGFIDDEVKKKLKADGYKVKTGMDKNEGYYKISWE